MNLIIDIGNSSSKIGVFENNQQIFETRLAEPGTLFFDDLFTKYNIKSCIVSSVKQTDEMAIIPYLKSKTHLFILLDENTPLPINNTYETPDTLGKDRLAAAVGANFLYPNQNILVIDCGTAITYEFVSKDEYRGGNIAPGLEMRYKALNQFTNRLPLLPKNDNFSFLGKNTNQAINNGVINGIIFEIEGYVSQLEAEFPDLKVVLTGGDAIFFAKKLKKTIFVVANLVLIGLNRILEHNEK